MIGFKNDRRQSENDGTRTIVNEVRQVLPSAQPAIVAPANHMGGKMSKDNQITRRDITFGQAEGVEPLPIPLALREVSQELRAYLWNVFDQFLAADIHYDDYNHLAVGKACSSILMDWHVTRLHKFSDEFSNRYDVQRKLVKAVFENGTYIDIFNFVEFFCRHPSRPSGFENVVNKALKAARSPYRIIDQSVIPLSSEEEGQAVLAAFAATNTGQFAGARTHLREAGRYLSAGEWAKSIRECQSACKRDPLSARKRDPLTRWRKVDRTRAFALRAA